ncbi:extracellular solute-binding protein [Cupriavidus basilensis OR16]|uniref:Extracellular solute-binding protein n=2 Tax=Cupriavidus basilensis TaxID=68895 RepID=H1SGE4_9BURK|nr:extracellular solute-binding protein [Cupriavidus basilensis OR16]
MTKPTMPTIAVPCPVKAVRAPVSPSPAQRQCKRPWLALMLGAVASVALGAGNALADEVKVMNSGGFTAAYKALGPGFEKATGNTLSTAWGPSMGKSPEAIPNRLARGEHADVVIMVGYALDDLIKQGKVVPDSRVELADSRIGLSVREGAPKPDISTVDAFRKTLLDARSIAYSDSASGVYVETEMFKKLGIEEQVKGRAHKIEKTPVGQVVAQGDYQVGLQQVSELLPAKGASFVGKIPEPMQKITTFAAGVPVGAEHPEAGRALIRYLASPAARGEIERSGMDAVVGRQRGQ